MSQRRAKRRDVDALASARRGGPKLPAAYVEDIKTLSRELNQWAERNPGARPDFRWPDRSVMLIGPLTVDAADASGVLGNDDARRCVAELDERTGGKMTLFMLRVALDFLPPAPAAGPN